MKNEVKKRGGHSTKAKGKDGRRNNGGHSKGGRKKLSPEKKQLGVSIFLSPEEFAGDWKSNVCEQFEKKFKDKLKNSCNSI